MLCLVIGDQLSRIPVGCPSGFRFRLESVAIGQGPGYLQYRVMPYAQHLVMLVIWMLSWTVPVTVGAWPRCQWEALSGPLL